MSMKWYVPFMYYMLYHITQHMPGRQGRLLIYLNTCIMYLKHIQTSATLYYNYLIFTYTYAIQMLLLF